MADLSDSLTHVRLRNYKSIATCDLEVGPLAILVGPNGAGKSNYLDALRFVADALRGSLAGVIEERGGFREIRHRGKNVARSLALVLGFRLSAGEGWYGFRLERRGDGYVVEREVCQVKTKHKKRTFSVVEGEVEAGPRAKPPADATELYLARVGRIGPLRCRVPASLHNGLLQSQCGPHPQPAAPGRRTIAAERREQSSECPSPTRRDGTGVERGGRQLPSCHGTTARERGATPTRAYGDVAVPTKYG